MWYFGRLIAVAWACQLSFTCGTAAFGFPGPSSQLALTQHSSSQPADPELSGSFHSDYQVPPRRSLLAKPKARAAEVITIVYTFQELLDAWTAGAAHIELRDHMDSTSFPFIDAEIHGRTFSHTLPPQKRTTRSIMGNCAQAPDQSFKAGMGGVPLSRLKPGQCVVLTKQHLIPLVTGTVWVDNLYLRFSRPIAGSFAGELENAGDTDSHSSLAIFHSHGGKAWVTNLSVQGDGISPSGAVVVYAGAQLRFIGAEFSSLYASAPARGLEKPTVLVNEKSMVAFTSCRVFNIKQDEGVPLFAGDSTALLSLQEMTFENVSMPHIEVIPGAMVFSDDPQAQVWIQKSQAGQEPKYEAPQPLSQAQVMATFLSLQDTLYLNLRSEREIISTYVNVTQLLDLATSSPKASRDIGNSIGVIIGASLGGAGMLLLLLSAALCIIRCKRSSKSSGSIHREDSLHQHKNAASGAAMQHPPHHGSHSSQPTDSFPSESNPSGGSDVPLRPQKLIRHGSSSLKAHTPHHYTHSHNSDHFNSSESHHKPQTLMVHGSPGDSPTPQSQSQPPHHYPPAPNYSGMSMPRMLPPISSCAHSDPSYLTKTVRNRQSIEGIHTSVASHSPVMHMATLSGDRDTFPSIRETYEVPSVSGKGMTYAEHMHEPHASGRSPVSSVLLPTPHCAPKTPGYAPPAPSYGVLTDTCDVAKRGGTIFSVLESRVNRGVMDMHDYIHEQLDRIDVDKTILNGLLLLGNGRSARLEGGQSVVQMARSKHSGVEYAIKFYVNQRIFEAESQLYMQRISIDANMQQSKLARFLPEVRNVVTSKTSRHVDPSGNRLPPCIVMERGESLDIWAARAHPDRAQAFAMMHQLAERMRDFHALEYVHRDLKPGNVMWLPRENRWTVIDFGCAARTGEDAKLAFSLSYAAPEVMEAHSRGALTIVAQEAQDVWSLGVMVFELLTGRPAIPHTQDKELTMDKILGVNDQELPWEENSLTSADRRKLGIFKSIVLTLLSRDPAERPSMAQFCDTCDRVLGGTTTEHMTREHMPVSQKPTDSATM